MTSAKHDHNKKAPNAGQNFVILFLDLVGYLDIKSNEKNFFKQMYLIINELITSW